MEKYTHEERVALRTADWSANVVDKFKGMSVDEVRAALAPARNNLVFAFENAIRDFNFSALIRACNAFACAGVIYTGFRKFDPRGAVGTKHYENIEYLETADFDLRIDFARSWGVRFVVAEFIEEDNPNADKMISLPDYDWSEFTILMLGEESVGVSQKYLDMADDIVYIPQRGSVRSMNVASVGHVLAYDYMTKTGRF